MSNERLRSRLAARGMTTIDLASTVEVDPKTVERWIGSNRIPHHRHRVLTANVLEAEEAYLWPQLVDSGRARSASQAEVLGIYPNRGEVPFDLWRRLVEAATSNVDILVYSGLFLLDSHPDLPTKLIKRAGAGLEGRFLYGEPESETVAARGVEEGIGENLAARIRLSLTYMQPIVGTPGLEIRQHDTVLYNSLYRFDDELLVNLHVAGSPALHNPVLHLRGTDGGHLFDQYMSSFERVWTSAQAGSRASSPVRPAAPGVPRGSAG